MKLYIRQKVFSWRDRFMIKDENGCDRYRVEGELFSWGKKLHVYDQWNQEAAFIQQKVWSFLPRFYVYVQDHMIAEIVKEFTFFYPKYRVSHLGWEIEGSLMAHDYSITHNGYVIVSIHKEWMSWGDCYELDIRDPKDEIIALAVVLAIDCVMAQDSAVTAGANA